MTKRVRELSVSELPEPFASYWGSEDKLPRPYRFFDVAGELYILDQEYDSDNTLMHHWTADGCAGIACFMIDRKIKQQRHLPYVELDGTYLFECIPSDEYETSIRNPTTGKMHVVHSG